MNDDFQNLITESAAGCCGGPADDACCVADAEAKASGNDGCGCGSTSNQPAEPKLCC